VTSADVPGPNIPGTLLLEPEVLEDPYPFYARLRQEAPFWRIPGTRVFVASSYAVIDDITARTDDFSNVVRSLLYRGDDGVPQQLEFGAGIEALASADPPVHILHRKAVFPELVAKKMAELAPDISSLAERCVDTYVTAGGDFMDTVANPVPINVISWLIGFQEADTDVLLQAAADSTLMVGGAMPLDGLTPLIERTAEVSAWIGRQITAGGAPKDVLLGTIAKAVDEEAITLDQGVIILHTLLSAGGESTTSLIGNAARILAEHPELQDQLRRQPDLVPNFVEEVLRLESPFRMQMRSVVKATSCNGVDVPAGSTVMLFYSAANRDPAQYDDPDEIKLDRNSPRVHLAFGRGIHFCVGAHLARLEANLVLDALLTRTTSIRIDPDRLPIRVQSLLARRHQELPLKVQ
jgi:cytochrome P450 family 144